MTDVALDANVIVALLYDADVHRKRAVDLIDRLERDGHAIVLLDVLVFEATSVLCRRARQRKTSPPDLSKALDVVGEWFERGFVRSVAELLPSHADEILDVVRKTDGALNVNDAAVVVLARHGVIDALATFDPGFDAIDDLERFV